MVVRSAYGAALTGTLITARTLTQVAEMESRALGKLVRSSRWPVPVCGSSLPALGAGVKFRPVTDASEPAQRPKRWRYLIPNAITCFGLLLGLTAAFRAMTGTADGFRDAGWLVILCVLLDKLDGTVARLLKATSAIGGQLDSFSDFVTFGIAPGTLVLTLVNANPGGVFEMWHADVPHVLLHLLVSTYVLCACIRLARFNLLPPDPPDAPKIFWGMPTTFAGAFVASTFLVADAYGAIVVMRWMPVLLALLGILMVSNARLPKVAPREPMWLNIIQALDIGAVYVAGLFRLLPEFLLANVVAYFVFGFGWGFLHRSELPPPRLEPHASS